MPKSNKHTNAILRPTSCIHKIRKNKPGILMRLRSRRYGNRNDKPADQRCRQGDFGDPRQRSGVAVPDEGEAVDEEVSKEDVPGLNYAIAMSVGAVSTEKRDDVQLWMRKLIASHNGTRRAQSYRSRGEDTPSPGKPACQIRGEVGILLRGQLTRPLIDWGSAFLMERDVKPADTYDINLWWVPRDVVDTLSWKPQ